eukprot:10541434-Karenia_brevis.AAC.1
MGRLGWDLTAEQCETVARGVLEAAKINPDSCSEVVGLVLRNGKGSMAQVKFASHFDVQMAKS